MAKLEIIQKRAEQQINSMRKISEALEVVREKSVKFDGKVVNKRYFDFINSEIEKTGNKCKLNKSGRSYVVFEIIDVNKHFVNGVNCYNPEYSQLSSEDISREFAYKENSPIGKDGRLNNAKMIEEVEKELGRISVEMERKYRIIKDGAKMQKKIKEAAEKFNEILTNAPYELRGGLNLLHYQDY